MVDYLKLRVKVSDPEGFMLKAKQDRFGNLNFETGEIGNPIVIKIKNVTIKAYLSGTIYLTGSLHKFSNDGKHNYDDFYFSTFKDTVEEIFYQFEIPLSEYKIENIEFGVNILMRFNTDIILDRMLFHGRHYFLHYAVKQGKYIQAEKSNYILKAYNKAAQYGRPGNLFRWEIKFKRTHDLKPFHIISLLDLLDRNKLLNLATLLVKTWNQVVFIDPSLDDLSFNAKEKSNYLNWSNPLWWKRLEKKCSKRDVNKFNREVNAFRRFSKLKSEGIQEEICNLIKEKVNYLIGQ